MSYIQSYEYMFSCWLNEVHYKRCVSVYYVNVAIWTRKKLRKRVKSGYVSLYVPANKSKSDRKCKNIKTYATINPFSSQRY